MADKHWQITIDSDGYLYYRGYRIEINGEAPAAAYQKDPKWNYAWTLKFESTALEDCLQDIDDVEGELV